MPVKECVSNLAAVGEQGQRGGRSPGRVGKVVG